MSILKVFNEQLLEFVDDLLRLFPNDPDLKASKVAVRALKKVNPRALIINWQYYVTNKYKKEILEGDIDFFINKNYDNDIVDVEDKGGATEAIERLRPALRKIGQENKDKATKYLQNLTKLSQLYNK
jgi:uncharacterized protein (UPF0305 family)